MTTKRGKKDIFNTRHKNNADMLKFLKDSNQIHFWTVPTDLLKIEKIAPIVVRVVRDAFLLVSIKARMISFNRFKRRITREALIISALR